MIPMAIFTPVYAIWPTFAWPLPGGAFLTAALAWSAYLAVTASRILKLSRTLPRETNDSEVWAITGTGGALVTSSYGLYIVRAARQTLTEYENTVGRS